MHVGKKAKKLVAKTGLRLMMKSNFVRELFLRWGEKQILKSLVIKNKRRRPIGAQEEKFYIVRNIMKSFEAKFKANYLAPTVKDWVFNTLIGDVMLNWADRHPKAKMRRLNEDPAPVFITISPTQRCNLACIGCYAASSSKTAAMLEWDVIDKIIEQKRELWGSYFTVISGGEPLIYEDRGKTILDIFEKHRDNFFLLYTNGTLIDSSIAKKLAALGNVAPAISIEGFEKDTDKRRGKGVYAKILQAIENLKDAGVIYGISFTATRDNVDNILGDAFIDEFFGERGAVFAWMFQYLPIGRGPDFDLMITPEQRRNLWFKERYLIKNKGISFVDFWNGGPISDGCISAGRKGGYLYIDWHGNVTPCVFIPYTVGNIKTDFFDKGKTLDDILETPFFKGLREWQAGYSYKKQDREAGNEIVPCPIRDHHADFHRIAEESGAVPADATAQKSFQDSQFIQELAHIGEEAHRATEDIWRKEYLKV